MDTFKLLKDIYSAWRSENLFSFSNEDASNSIHHLLNEWRKELLEWLVEPMIRGDWCPFDGEHDSCNIFCFKQWPGLLKVNYYDVLCDEWIYSAKFCPCYAIADGDVGVFDLITDRSYTLPESALLEHCYDILVTLNRINREDIETAVRLLRMEETRKIQSILRPQEVKINE